MSKTGASSDQKSYLKFDFQAGRNKVWIGFLIFQWVREHALLSMYTDILRYFGSGGDFCYHSTFSSIPLVFL